MRKNLALALALALSPALALSQHVHSVYFGGGSYYIDGNQASELRQFIESVPDLQHFQISISSHTDNIGGVEYNQWLS